MKYIVFILFALFFIGCDPVDSKLTLINNTDSVLFYRTSTTNSLDGLSPYKYSFEVQGGDTVWDVSRNLILPKDSAHLQIIGEDAWEDFINNDCEDSTMRVFIFTKGVLESFSWNTILKKQLYTNKYNLTVENLQESKWKVNVSEPLKSKAVE